jgi:hypothetical protein
MLIHKSQRAEVDGEDEFYAQDLVGLTVLLQPYHAASQASADSYETTDASDFESQSESDEADVVPAVAVSDSSAEAARHDTESGQNAEVQSNDGSAEVQSSDEGVIASEYSLLCLKLCLHVPPPEQRNSPDLAHFCGSANISQL